MKVKPGYMIREVAGYNVVVPVGDATMNFNGMINLNETGAFLWKLLEEDTDEEKLVGALLAEYDIAEDAARRDVGEFIAKMKEANLIDE